MSNKMQEIGLKYRSDKITHHKYHETFDLYLQKWYNKEGAMLEIGIEAGRSMKMWPELFPNAHVFGMDIDVYFSSNNCTVIQGDQSKVEDLNKVKSAIKDKNLFFINDDGSHIPEHQLLTFNELFPLLCEGGIYIIEDIETSYWTKGELYGYQANYGYKHPNSIIEVFKDVADSVNSEFAGEKNNKVLHHNKIGSVTFAKNCIIIVKKTQEKREYRWKEYL